MLLHTLRGQYEAIIIGELEVVFHKQQHFREIWRKAVFTYFGETIKWRYAPPRWLLPPSSRKDLEFRCVNAVDEGMMLMFSN